MKVVTIKDMVRKEMNLRKDVELFVTRPPGFKEDGSQPFEDYKVFWKDDEKLFELDLKLPKMLPRPKIHSFLKN